MAEARAGAERAVRALGFSGERARALSLAEVIVLAAILAFCLAGAVAILSA